MVNSTWLLIGSLLALAPQISRGADFFVAPNGTDTLVAARDAARKAGPGPHRIVVKSGEYFLDATFELDARDNGLTIEAAEPGKAILYGGRLVTGWRRDGDKFWCADIPAGWDFRALVVGSRMPDRARFPETGTFLHRSVFDVPWLSSVGGGWARKPTEHELNTLLYDPKDLPATLDVRNAEVRVYHMWDESLVGVASNDGARHELQFSTPAKSPAGAFGVKKYVVFNTREGMTQPGQWYLDRGAGRVVYWPLPGEDMAKMKVVAPRLERVVGIKGTAQAPVERITLRGLSIQATTTPLKPGGFGAGAYDGAVGLEWARQCVLEKLEIANVGGQGIQSRDLTECRISDSHIHDIGACGIRASGTATQLARNHIHHVGRYHPSAPAISASHEMRQGGKGFHLYRNEIHDTPYSGIIAGGGGHLIEENLISRVMRELQDGGAIYGGIKDSILRGNIVRDVVKMGEGYGVSSYYLDEGAQNCIVERNVSIGVERPTHNHIARNLIIRDNVFIADKDMALSFQRSGDCTFTGNTLYVPGKLNISQPSAVTKWQGNVIFGNGVIHDDMPVTPPPARRTWAIPVERVTQAPVLDGEIGWEEWPRQMWPLDRDATRWNAMGAPVFAKVSHDGKNLYVAVNVAMFDVKKLGMGAAWNKDDGAEIAIAGKNGTYVLRGFANGKLLSETVAGVSAGSAAALGAAVRFSAKTFGNNMGGWRGEWAIPFEALGITPAAGLKIPFNIVVYRAEDGITRWLEGTLAESWKLDQASTLQLK